MHQPVQIVDSHGNAVGVASSPAEAIKEEHIRLIVRVIITDRTGDAFLLQRRSDGMYMYPGCWDMAAAGHVDEGESTEEAAYRELKEEIGLEVALEPSFEYYDELYIEKYDINFKSYNHIYRGVFNGDISKLALQPSEVSEVRWLPRQEIERLVSDQPKQCTDGLIKIFGNKLL